VTKRFFPPGQQQRHGRGLLFADHLHQRIVRPSQGLLAVVQHVVRSVGLSVYWRYAYLLIESHPRTMCVDCLWVSIGHTQDIQPPFPGEDPSITSMRGKVLDVLCDWTRLYEQARPDYN
jgi:hypothetical protein